MRDESSGTIHTLMLGAWWLRPEGVDTLPVVPASELHPPPSSPMGIAGAAAEAAWRRDAKALVRGGITTSSQIYRSDDGTRSWVLSIKALNSLTEIMKAVDVLEMRLPDGSKEFLV